MLHPRAGHSDKVSGVSDFEYRVWTQYMLSADDFGLMPCEAICLQADNRALAKKAVKVVQKALERLIAVELLKPYQDAQGRRYVCDPVWQKYQHIEYPKQSINPPPSADVLATLHHLTQELFRQCFGKKSARFRLKDVESSPNVSREVDDGLTLRAGGRAETANANGKRLTAPAIGPAFRTDGAAAGMNPKDHLKHAACDDTYSRCVPTAVHSKLCDLLAPKHGGDRQAAGQVLKAWYPLVWATLAPNFVMGEAFKFWQAQFDGAHATPQPVAGRREEPKSTVPGADRTAAYLREQRLG